MAGNFRRTHGRLVLAAVGSRFLRKSKELLAWSASRTQDDLKGDVGYFPPTFELYSTINCTLRRNCQEIAPDLP